MKQSDNPAAHKRWLQYSSMMLIVLFAVALSSCRGCRGRSGGSDSGPTQPQDGRVVEGGTDWQDNREVLSPIILREPLYECTKVVMVSGFIPGAEITVFEGSNLIATEVGTFSSGQQITVSIEFVKDQIITARQRFNGVTSGPSNAVRVRGVRDDYPAGLPTPEIVQPPLYECGIAIGAAGFLPGATVIAESEPSTGGGMFGPPAEIGRADIAAPYPGGWMYINPPYVRDARVTLHYKICDQTAPRSAPQIVQPQPTITKPTVDPAVYEGGTIVVVRDILNGARIKVFSNTTTQIGESGTPGGGGQQIFISPAAASGTSLTATQSLCATSDPSDSVPVRPCSELPAAIAKQPQPGDDQIELITYVPGARIIVLSGTEEIGDGGPPIVKLTRPVNNGETLTIIQMLGDCRSRWVHVITVRCPFGSDPKACSADWPMFRHNTARTAQQPKPSALANPELVKVLKVQPGWPVQPAGAGPFRASPIVYNGRVYVGNSNGRFYAFDAVSGAQLWQYPSASDPPLTSQFVSNPSSEGIASSATIARIRQTDRGEVDAVIFGAPDQSIGRRLGSGRLFALNAQTGAEIWKSDEVAVLDGLDFGSTSQRHEQIGYSSPLVLNDRVYVGIADHGDNPIQNGRVVAVNLNNGVIDGAFNYSSTNTRGGGVWSSVAGGPDGELYVTTGNARCWNGGCQSEPSVNHSLSLIRLDPATGAVVWKLQPVPFDLDGDPDWASGAAFIPTGCGPRVASTMKDGWSYSVVSGGGALGWQFPPTGQPFTAADGTVHGDSRYLMPGAGWESVFITMMGGENVATATIDDQAPIREGFSRLHGLNLCGQNRVRWLFDVPGVAAGSEYQVGPPTVSRGIVYVGTSQSRLVAFADPSVYPSTSYVCSWLGVSPADCVANGFQLVPQPKLLLNLDLAGGGLVRNEPVLANGRIYVATATGRVFMIAP